MESFPGERPELTGSLISMEFGNGGRVSSLWASDPSLPDEGEEFQFVLPPLPFGEENAEDLYPGTILVGARTSPTDPWIFSRNSAAQAVMNFEEEQEYPPREMMFQYDFPLLPELEVVGRFHEITTPFPQICWDIEVRNRGRVSLEIGELGFPLALNTFYDGFGWSDEQLKRLWNSRLHVHKYIGGAASWIFAQRMTSEPPGLLIYPGDDHGWEFFSSVPVSLSTPHQWEGIPVVYAYSRATVEKEGWQKWHNEHTALVLEPRDSRVFRVCMVPTDRDRNDGISQTLAAVGRPAIRVLPSCVAPVDVGIGIEVQGVSTRRWFVNRQAEIQTDNDENGGFAFVRPAEPGRLRVSFEDARGRLSHVHLVFTEPMEAMIKKRASYIAQHQVVNDPNSALDGAIVLTDTETGEPVTDVEEYAGASGIECSLADALYLAEKNSLYPVREEIATIDRYIEEFLLDDVQNPGDMSVGSVLAEGVGVGAYAGRPITYPSVIALYHAMYKVSKTYGETRHKPEVYLVRAAQTALAMFQFGWRNYVRTVGLLGFARIYDVLSDLDEEGLEEYAEEVRARVESKADAIVDLEYPYAGESVLDTSGFEEVFRAGVHADDDEHMERTLRCAFAARSISPSWWWYGSDKRSWDGADSAPLKALVDRGEACLAHTTIPNSLIFFEYLDRDYLAVPDVYMRLAFGGMIGPWALVRNDGAASMCYCPDPASKHFGYNRYTGASGLGYFHYLREAGAWVLPSGSTGTYTFGCHFETEGGAYTVRPWDGVGRKVILRQIGAEFRLSFGKITLVRLDHRKRWFEVRIENPCDKDIRAELSVKGMWGKQLQINGRLVDCERGEGKMSLVLPAGQTVHVTGKVAE